jgi:flagellar protein FliO/FliZ
MFSILWLWQAESLPEMPGWWAYFKVILLLAGILALGYAALRLLAGRRGLMLGKSRSGHLAIVDRLPLEPRRGIYIVRAGSQYYVLASSERGIQTIGELTSSPEPPRSSS